MRLKTGMDLLEENNMTMEMTFIVTGIGILVVSAILAPIVYFIFEHDSKG